VSSIPLADASLLAPIHRRTVLLRATLGAVVVAAIVSSILVSREPHRQTIVELPGDSSVIVVLDMSASISSDTFSRIGTTLSELAESRGRYGLVVFSDQAYEALPPESPAADLKPLIRYFTLPRQRGPGFAPQFPSNPWSRSFSAGTKISAGLSLAHDIALSEQRQRPAVVLVSDLDDDPQDVQRLAVILLAYRRDRIPIEVVALNASTEDLALFARVLGRSALVPVDATDPGGAPRNRTPFPWPLFALALVAAFALAAHELWAPRLEWETSTS